VAAATLYPASSANTWVTGGILIVDGRFAAH
jgi:hypothetical protein